MKIAGADAPVSIPLCLVCNPHDNFSDLGVGLHVPMCLDNLIERKNTGNMRQECAGGQMLPNVLLPFGADVRLSRNFEERISADSQSLFQCRKQRKRCGPKV